MNTQTVPAQSIQKPRLVTGNTAGTFIMKFESVASHLSSQPLRGFRHQRLDDVEISDDLAAAQAALAESDETLPYEDVRKELGLDG